MESSTRATFNVIESIVGAFGGFAQMLDSTYMATHSSFMAMVGVAEQFGNLRLYLGNILGIFALIRFMKKLLYRITGRTPPPELDQPEEGQEGANNQITENGEPDAANPTQSPENNQQVTVSRKRPVLIFLALVTGIPYLMYRLIKRSNEYRAQQMRMMITQPGMGPPEMARAMYDFVAEQPIELNLRKGEMVEVLSKVDPATGAPCEWWQGRSSNGAVGIFPATYVQIQSKGY
jgi:peroxin-13